MAPDVTALTVIRSFERNQEGDSIHVAPTSVRNLLMVAMLALLQGHVSVILHNVGQGLGDWRSRE